MLLFQHDISALTYATTFNIHFGLLKTAAPSQIKFRKTALFKQSLIARCQYFCYRGIQVGKRFFEELRCRRRVAANINFDQIALFHHDISCFHNNLAAQYRVHRLIIIVFADIPNTNNKLSIYYFISKLFMIKNQEDIHHILQVIEKGDPKLKCSEGYLIQHICVNKTCEASSGFCSNRTCEQCTTRHSLCQCFRIDSLTQLLQNPSKQAHWLIKEVKKLQRRLKNIKFKIKDFRSEVCLRLLDHQERDVIEAIYTGQSECELNGSGSSILFQKLKRISEIIDVQVTASLQGQKSKVQKISAGLIEIENNIECQLSLNHNIKLDTLRQKIAPKQSSAVQQLKKKCQDLERSQQKNNAEAKIARDNFQHFKNTFNIRQEQLNKEIARLKQEKEDEATQGHALRKEKQLMENLMNQNLAKIGTLQAQLKTEAREQMHLKEMLQRQRKQNSEINHKMEKSQIQRNDAQRSQQQKTIQQLQTKIVNLEKRLKYKRKEDTQKGASEPLVGLQFIFSHSTLEQIDRVADKWKYHLLKSKIIPTNRIEQLRFIYQSLKRPKNMQLLFRASENGFLAKNFHHFCDNVPNTFTLLRTQFGKTIGAYTPLLMDSPEKPKFFTDHSNRSFLLSIDLWQKMYLNETNRAIKCNRDVGPIFGAGCDLVIADRCHVNNSFANFPWSYNSKSNYKCNQKTWTAFCGAPSGKQFKIVEYQVYKVKW